MSQRRFTRVGDILPAILKSTGLDRKLKEREILELWPEAVGPEIASRTEPIGIDKGVLHVYVEHGAWRQELHFMANDIVQKLHVRAPDVELKRIRFTAKR